MENYTFFSEKFPKFFSGFLKLLIKITKVNKKLQINQ